MNEAAASRRPAAPPVRTSLGRFGAAFTTAAVASVCLPFAITPILITWTGQRELGMVIGVFVGMMAGWCLFPFIAWRPFRAVHLLALPLVAVIAAAGVAVLPEHWLTSVEGDRNGMFGAMINVAICALIGYGGLTWWRNSRVRAGAGESARGLSQ